MSREAVSTGKAPRAIGPYSQAIRADGWVFVSGQIPLDPATGEVVAGGIRDQTERVLGNVKAILEAAGAGLADVVKTTVYLQDLGEFPAMNEAYARFFPEAPPARATIEAAKLPKGVRIEIDAIARART